MSNDKAGNADNLENELESLPDKFKGKSAVEIAKSYVDLESAFSRQGGELGEYKRLAQTLAETGLKPPVEAPKREPVTTDSLLENPEKAIESVIEDHPAVRQARETAENLERQLAQSKFESSHPSFREDVKDPAFSEWVKKSSHLLKLATQADKYDMDAADQLFSMWEERKTMFEESKNKFEKQKSRAEKEKAGTLEGVSGADASTETTYSRADIIEIKRQAALGNKSAQAKVSDPKWKAMLLQAYKDKRVS